ncbi:MAG: VOC family protein [Myxococcota bacterium]
MHIIHHIAILVSDLDRSERFYRHTLGLVEVRRWYTEHGNLRSIWYALSSENERNSKSESESGATPFLAVELRDGLDRGVIVRCHCLAIGIEASARDEWESRLAKHGVSIEERSPYTIYFRDPDENRIGLSHYPNLAESSSPKDSP